MATLQHWHELKQQPQSNLEKCQFVLSNHRLVHTNMRPSSLQMYMYVLPCWTFAARMETVPITFNNIQSCDFPFRFYNTHMYFVILMASPHFILQRATSIIIKSKKLSKMHKVCYYYVIYLSSYRLMANSNLDLNVRIILSSLLRENSSNPFCTFLLPENKRVFRKDRASLATASLRCEIRGATCNV